MNRRKVGLTLIGAGVVLALMVGIVVYLQVAESEQLRAAQPKRWVAIASTDIPERTVITGDQIAVVQLPDAAVPPGAASYIPDGAASVEEVESRKQSLMGRVKDQFTPTRIFKGEVINTERLGREVGKNLPSYDLPAGKVAYVFPIKVNGGTPANERIHLAFLNAIRPGDYIDIYFSDIEIPFDMPATLEEKIRSKYPTTALRTRRLMQLIKVLNVGYFAETGGRSNETPRDDRYLTMEMTPDEALQLKWLKDAATLAGNIEFVLRSPLDTQPFPQTTVTMDTMSQQFGLGTDR